MKHTYLWKCMYIDWLNLHKTSRISNGTRNRSVYYRDVIQSMHVEMKIDNDQHWKVISYFRHRAGEGLALTVIYTFTFLSKQWPIYKANQRNYWITGNMFRIPRGQSTSCIVLAKPCGVSCYTSSYIRVVHSMPDMFGPSQGQDSLKKTPCSKLKRCWCDNVSIRPCMYIMHRTK